MRPPSTAMPWSALSDGQRSNQPAKTMRAIAALVRSAGGRPRETPGRLNVFDDSPSVCVCGHKWLYWQDGDRHSGAEGQPEPLHPAH
jgi:hypothetical protein